MTKRNLLFVSLLFVFALGAMAPSLFAQGTVWYGSSNQNTIRNEGDAEAVGTITLTSTSQGTIESPSGFTILYTLPIAYYKFATGIVYAVGVSCPIGDTAHLCDDITATVPSPNVVELTFGAYTPVLPISGVNSINIAVRVQSQGVASGTGLTATLTSFYKYGNQDLMIASPMGHIIVGLGRVQGPATTVTYTAGPEYALTCIGLKDITDTPYDNAFSLRITENWNDALTSLSDEYSLENNDASYQAGSATPLYPTNGSYILITLSGIPSDGGAVGAVAGAALPCDGVHPTASNYCAGGNLTFQPPVAVTPGSPYGAVQQFWYQIDTTNVQAVEFADFPFQVWSKGPLPPNKGYEITATVSLTDLYPNTVTTAPPNGDMPWFSASETPTPIPVVYFFDCVTKLLFPYINTFGSGAATTAAPFSTFGTGIDIANTTWDPFALPGPGGVGYLYPDEEVGAAIPQSGNCTFYFYPADESASTVYSTPTISAGGSYAFDVATATGGLTPPFTNKTGYAIAICGFQNAHGFAEIYDNYANMGTVGPHTILGYRPEVLPDPAFYHRTPPGDWLGEGAIAPINIERSLLKTIMGIVPWKK